jgi:hypothetical protein
MTTISLTWDRGTVEAGQLEPSPDLHFPYIVPGGVVSLAIAHQSITHSPKHTHLLHVTVSLNAIAPNLADHLPSILLPFQYSQTVSDPSILHLLQSLQTEMQSPQRINQLFVSSIVTVLTIHLLQNFQLEQDRS